jgi:uncharacterized membrane protein
MKQRLLYLLFCLFWAASKCFAQLTLINPSERPVALAIGFYVEKGLWQGWNTKGWITIAPRDSATVLPEGINGGGFYYYGRTGCDQGYTGSSALFLHPTEAFAIANAAAATPITLNKDVKKAGFVKVDIPAGQRYYRLRLPALNCSRQGVRNGDWLIYLDRDKEEVAKVEQASYVRHISYQQGVPVGLVRDYTYPANILQWDGKLLREHPAIAQGTCITYDEAGHKREQALYQNGKVVGGIQHWDAAGQEVAVVKKYRTVKVLEPQQGYLVSYFNPGKSRTVIPVKLPANTVSWYYEFAAFRDQAQLASARARFKLAAELSALVDQSGIANLAMKALTMPPGGNICNVYLLGDTKQTDLFQAKQAFSFLRDGTRSSLTSAVVPVMQPAGQQVYLGLHNPDNLYGIHYALEVVAVVEE